MIEDHPEFVDEVLGILSCARLENPKKILETFLKPLQAEHLFKEDINYHVLKPRFGKPRKLTALHQEEYLKVLKEKLRQYKTTVEKNKQVSSDYSSPLFEPDQAREVAAEALIDAYWLAKESYRIA